MVRCGQAYKDLEGEEWISLALILVVPQLTPRSEIPMARSWRRFEAWNIGPARWRSFPLLIFRSALNLSQHRG